jgi:hypothetical protein
VGEGEVVGVEECLGDATAAGAPELLGDRERDVGRVVLGGGLEDREARLGLEADPDQAVLDDGRKGLDAPDLAPG